MIWKCIGFRPKTQKKMCPSLRNSLCTFPSLPPNASISSKTLFMHFCEMSPLGSWLLKFEITEENEKLKGHHQFSSVAQSCLTLRNPMNRSTPGLPVHHHLPEFTQTHVHQVCDAIQPSHPRSSPSPPALNPSQHQSLFQWVNSSHQVEKVVEFQLGHHSFQKTPRNDL